MDCQTFKMKFTTSYQLFLFCRGAD